MLITCKTNINHHIMGRLKETNSATSYVQLVTWGVKSIDGLVLNPGFV